MLFISITGNDLNTSEIRGGPQEEARDVRPSQIFPGGSFDIRPKISNRISNDRKISRIHWIRSRIDSAREQPRPDDLLRISNGRPEPDLLLPQTMHGDIPRRKAMRKHRRARRPNSLRALRMSEACWHELTCH